MGYDEDEDLGGDPIELYLFTGPGANVWRYTSDGVSHTHDGQTYTPIAISRGELPSDGTADPEALVVRIPGSNAVSLAYGFGNPYRSLTLTVFRYQGTEFLEIWHGPVPHVAPDGDWTDLRCPSLLADRIQSDAPAQAFQKQCNNRVGDDRCRKDITGSPFTIASAVSSVSADGYTVTVSTVGGAADAYFAAGDMVRDSDGESRMIVSQVGSILTLFAPFRTLAAADDLTLVVGCDRYVTTCRDKFGNVINFTGHDFVPVSRLFDSNLHKWQP